MKLISKISLMTLAGISLCTNFVLADSKANNLWGGGACVCRSSADVEEFTSITKAHMLDLVEAEANGLQINYTNNITTEELIENALQKIAHTKDYWIIKNEIEDVIDKINIMGPFFELNKIDDTFKIACGEYYKNKNCKAE